MIKITIILVFSLLLIFTACGPPKKIFFFAESIPPQMRIPEASQEFFDHPPLYIPKGKRKTISVYSPHFTLAITNVLDMSGDSKELQRSLTDILYTEMFNYPGKRRIDLLDRGTVLNLDLKNIMDPLNNREQGPPLQGDETKSMEQENKIPVVHSSSPEQRAQELNQIMEATRGLKDILKNADGILQTYITSRNKTQNGYCEVDYRIVINRGLQKQIVLLAGTERIHYTSDTSTAEGIQYKREDVGKIVKRIYDDMTLQVDKTRKAQIVKYDPPFIVINIGKEHNLMPGMIGYVVEWDESVKIQDAYNEGSEDLSNPPHYSYIAEFIVTDVFSNTSNAQLIRPEFDWGVKVDDVVVIK